MKSKRTLPHIRRENPSKVATTAQGQRNPGSRVAITCYDETHLPPFPGRDFAGVSSNEWTEGVGNGKAGRGIDRGFSRLRPRCCCSADVSFVRFAGRGRRGTVGTPRPEGEAHSECDFASPDSHSLEVGGRRKTLIDSL